MLLAHLFLATITVADRAKPNSAGLFPSPPTKSGTCSPASSSGTPTTSPPACTGTGGATAPAPRQQAHYQRKSTEEPRTSRSTVGVLGDIRKAKRHEGQPPFYPVGDGGVAARPRPGLSEPLVTPPSRNAFDTTSTPRSRSRERSAGGRPAHGPVQQAGATGSLEPVSRKPSLIQLPFSSRFHRSVRPQTPSTASPRAVQAMVTTVPLPTVPTAS